MGGIIPGQGVPGSCFGHPPFVAYPKRGGQQEWRVPLLSGGAGWLGARIPIPEPLHILFCGPPFFSLSTPHSFLETFPDFLGWGKTLFLSILMYLMPLHTGYHLQFCKLFG